MTLFYKFRLNILIREISPSFILDTCVCVQEVPGSGKGFGGMFGSNPDLSALASLMARSRGGNQMQGMQGMNSSNILQQCKCIFFSSINIFFYHIKFRTAVYTLQHGLALFKHFIFSSFLLVAEQMVHPLSGNLCYESFFLYVSPK